MEKRKIKKRKKSRGSRLLCAQICVRARTVSYKISIKDIDKVRIYAE